MTATGSDHLSPYEALKAAVLILNQGGGLDTQHCFTIEADGAGNIIDPWEKLYSLQDLLASVQEQLTNPESIRFDYSNNVARTIMQDAPQTVRSAIEQLNKPEVAAALSAYAAKLAASPNQNQTQQNIIALVESDQLIPKLEAMESLAETLKSRVAPDPDLPSPRRPHTALTHAPANSHTAAAATRTTAVRTL